MTNLTISLDESVIRSARVRAIQEGTSVSAKVREFLAQYAQSAPAPQSKPTKPAQPSREAQIKAGEAILAAAKEFESDLGGWKFNREEIYEERTRWPRQPKA